MPAPNVVRALLRLQVPSSFSYAFPYIAALILTIIIAILLLIKFPSLRKYQRKRNIIIYVVIFTVFALLMFQASDVTKRALVGYSLGSSSDKFYPRQTNQIDLSCVNHGDRTALFTIVVTCKNASFVSQNQQSYDLVNSQTVRVSFSLQESWSTNTESKSLYFVIDDNVTSFSFQLTLEGVGNKMTAVSGDSEVTSVWNETGNCYDLYAKSSFIV